jgi:hypothetical protein
MMEPGLDLCITMGLRSDALETACPKSLDD